MILINAIHTLEIPIDKPAQLTPSSGKQYNNMIKIGILNTKALAILITAASFVFPKPYKTPFTAALIAKEGMLQES